VSGSKGRDAVLDVLFLFYIQTVIVREKEGNKKEEIREGMKNDCSKERVVEGMITSEWMIAFFDCYV
jgi:hypothetical protein